MSRYSCFGLLVSLSFIALCAQAGPGDGIRVAGDALTASPFAAIGVSYESDTLMTPEEEMDDVSYDFTAGVDLNGKATWATASLRGWYQTRTYDTIDERNSDNLGESFSVAFSEVAGIAIGLSQSYSKITDYGFNESDVGLAPMGQQQYDAYLLEGVTLAAEREQQSYGLNLGRAFRKLHLTAGAGFSSASYDTADAGYASNSYENEELGGSDAISASAGAEYELTPKMSAVLTLGGSQQDSDVLMDDAISASARVGARYRATAKVDVAATVGYMQNDAGETSDGVELKQSGLAYDVSGVWQCSRKASASISAGSSMAASEAYAENIKRADAISASLDYDLSARWGASVSASARRDSYDDAIDGETSPEQDGVGGSAALTYQAPGNFLSVTLRANHDRYSSNIEDDYDITRVSLAANVKY